MAKISFCTENDLDKLQDFIHDKWKENHVLANDMSLMDFQHKSSEGYNFVISKNDNDQITAILGYIPLRQFDDDLTKSNDIWLAIWKVDEELAEPGIGFALLKWLEKQIKPDSIGSIGINPEVKRIYDILGYKTGTLNQFYILNPDIDNYQIARIKKKHQTPKTTSASLIKEISEEELQQIRFNWNPYKSVTYIRNRYINHPYYKYSFFGAYINDVIHAIFIIRKIELKGSSCMRIVDIQGDLTELDSLQESFVSILKQNQSEYIDCLNYGLSKEIFFNCAFELRNSDIIIPNYFEPFLQENIDILFAYKSKHPEYVMFKGDSDQDRPNALN